MKNFIISVVNRKGGAGKTPIAYGLALEFDCNLLSNEENIVEEFYGDYMIVSDELPLITEGQAIYDFGGFVDSGVLNIIKNSNLVIVPVNNEYDALKKTILTLNEIEKVNKNIIFVATKTDGKKDFNEIQNALSDYKYPFYELQQTKMFSYLTSTGKTIDDIYKDKVTANWWSGNGKILDQWNELISAINERIK